MQAAGGATAVVTSAGVVGAQQPAFGGWLSNTSNYDGVPDRRNQSEVTIAVGADGNGGNYAFAPAAVRIDPGTTVRWKWTGSGGAHNVHAIKGAEFKSGDPTSEAGVHFTHTVENAGVIKYQCDPHTSLGMRGVLVVGDVSLGDTEEDGTPTADRQGVAAETNGWPLPIRISGLVASASMGLVTLVLIYFTYLGRRQDARTMAAESGSDE